MRERKLPKWAQEEIRRLDREINRVCSHNARLIADLHKAQEDNAYLIMIVRRLRPELYDMVNLGSSWPDALRSI
jgi:hypothetical protein